MEFIKNAQECVVQYRPPLPAYRSITMMRPRCRPPTTTSTTLQAHFTHSSHTTHLPCSIIIIFSPMSLCSGRGSPWPCRLHQSSIKQKLGMLFESLSSSWSTTTTSPLSHLLHVTWQRLLLVLESNLHVGIPQNVCPYLNKRESSCRPFDSLIKIPRLLSTQSVSFSRQDETLPGRQLSLKVDKFHVIILGKGWWWLWEQEEPPLKCSPSMSAINKGCTYCLLGHLLDWWGCKEGDYSLHLSPSLLLLSEAPSVTNGALFTL